LKKSDHGLIKVRAWSFPGGTAENTEKHQQRQPVAQARLNQTPPEQRSEVL